MSLAVCESGAHLLGYMGMMNNYFARCKQLAITQFWTLPADQGDTPPPREPAVLGNGII